MEKDAKPLETTQGYAAPIVAQHSVFLDNRIGKLSDLVGAFAQTPGCSICALTVCDSSDHAVVRMITSDSAAATRLLKKHGFGFAARDVLVVQLSPKRTIRDMCYYLGSAELSIDFTYPLFTDQGRGPAIVVGVDDPTLGGRILCNKYFDLLCEGELHGP